MTQVTEMGYLTLGVSSLAAWREYATQVLGMEAVDGEDTKTLYLRMDYWHHRIKLVEDGSDDLITIGYRLAGVDEFKQMLEKLTNAGVQVREGSREEALERKVLEVMFVEDPNGFAIELFHGPLVQYNNPFQPGRRMHRKFKTGNNGLGHLLQNRRTEGWQEIHDFYTLLGFRGAIGYKMPVPEAPEPVELYFFDCANERQHTVAFGPPSEKRINHMMFEMEQMDDVGLTHDIVKLAQIPVIIEPGAHANDQMFSFYSKNPSGFMTEIGYGGRHPLGQSEYHEWDSYGHAPNMDNMKAFMVPA